MSYPNKLVISGVKAWDFELSQADALKEIETPAIGIGGLYDGVGIPTLSGSGGMYG